MIDKKKIDANFTAGGLLWRDFSSITPILIKHNFIDLINQEKENNILLGIPTESARKRVVSEIIRRYKIVNHSFWLWYLTIPENEQKLALFFICLKTYPLVLDLHIEVAIEIYKKGDSMNSFSVKMRLDELSATNDEIGSWSESTLNKINSQYRTTLKECGIFNGETLNAPMNISQAFWDHFNSIEESWFKELCFK